MAIIITDQYKLRQANFLDDRKGLASSVSALKSWDFANVPIPEGFEVYVAGIWYVYKSSHSVDPTLGKFRARNTDQGIDDIEEELKLLHKEDRKLAFDDTRDNAPLFSDLLSDTFWKDEDGVNHSRAGRIVTVTGDGANNGPWYLVNSDYTKAASWVKLLGRPDIDGLDPSDTKIYGTKKADQVFPKKAGTETISGSWTFTENSVFTKDLSVSGKTKTKDLEVTGNANISGDTLISGNEKVLGNLEVSGNETLGGNINITGNNITQGNTSTGTLTVESDSEVQGNSKVRGNENISGSLVVSGNTTTQGNTTTGSLNVSGSSKLGETEFPGGAGVKVVDGKTVATFDKIEAESSDIGDLDEQIEEKLGLLGVGNLLKNTGLQGQRNSKSLELDTNLYEDTKIYSDIKEDWNITTSETQIIADPGSISGFSFYLPNQNTQISQESAVNLIDGANYTLSWKQKGTISVSIDSYDLEIKKVERSAVSGYDCYYTKFTQTGTRKVEVRFLGGPGYVCEIKLEEGIIPTTWFPSLFDTDPVADEIHDYEYLKTAFSEYTDDGLVSSLFLKNQIKVGDYVDGEIENVWGGLSGVFVDSKDILFWSGSSYKDAQDLVYKIIKYPEYLDSLSYSELQSLTKAIITLGSRSIFTDLYAHGKLVGKFKGSSEGEHSGTFNGESSGTFNGESSGTFSGDSTGTFTGESSGTFNGDASGTFTGDASGTFTGDASGTFTGDASGTFTGESSGTFTGDASGTFTGDASGTFTGDASGTFTGTIKNQEGEIVEPKRGLSGTLVSSVNSRPIGSIPREGERRLNFSNGSLLLFMQFIEFVSTKFEIQDIELPDGKISQEEVIVASEPYTFYNGLCSTKIEGEEEDTFEPYTGWKPLYNLMEQPVGIHYLYFNEGYLVSVSTSEYNDNSNWY